MKIQSCAPHPLRWKKPRLSSLRETACQRGDEESKLFRQNYCEPIKGNQPQMLQQAQGMDALKDTPFLPTPNPATDGSKPGALSLPHRTPDGRLPLRPNPGRPA
jgi:hypothetical protein